MDRGAEEVGGITRVPLAVTLVELELHEMAGDGGEEHVAGLAANGVVELKDLIIAGTPLPHSHALVPGEDGGDGLRHRGLLRHVQNVHAARTHGLVRERNIRVSAVTPPMNKCYQLASASSGEERSHFEVQMNGKVSSE